MRRGSGSVAGTASAAAARQKGVNTLNGPPPLVATAEGSCSRCPGWLAVATPAAASAASTAASRAIQPGA